MKKSKILSSILLIILSVITIKSIFEIIARSMKPEELYVCSLQSPNETHSFETSMRLEWPLNISELWVNHSGRGIIGNDTFDYVGEGQGLEDHKVYGLQSGGEVRFFFDRLTGSVTYGAFDGPLVEGVCRLVS